MITKENYESYFIDYLEGLLPEALQEELDDFLFRHPDLREQMEGIEQVRLTPPLLKWEKKSALKQENRNGRMDYYAIAVSENVLTEDERKRVEKEMGEEKFREVAAVYSRLKMIPDLSIRYPEKRNLYRWSGWLYGVVRYGGVAALVLILFGIIFYWMGEDKAGESHSSPIVARLESKEIAHKAPAIPAILKDSSLAKPEATVPVRYLQKRTPPSVDKPIQTVQRIVAMSTIPADGDIAIGREIILIPKADLQAMKPGITFDQIAERDKKDYALTSDLKIEDNFLSNLIRAGKDWKEHFKNKDRKEYVLW